MTAPDYDAWLTSDPEDREFCEIHPDEPRPCSACRMQAQIERAEAEKERDR